MGSNLQLVSQAISYCYTVNILCSVQVLFYNQATVFEGTVGEGGIISDSVRIPGLVACTVECQNNKENYT